MSSIIDPELGTREYKAIQHLIFELAGISLSDHKQIMVKGRLSKRLRKLELDSYAEYLSLLSSSNAGEEITHFINSLTTNKTSFFREQHHFQYLKQKAFPQLVEQAKDGRPKKLRIWCSASSTGEEPYSIAMTVRDFFGASSEWDIRILASDIDTNVLQTASQGVYGNEYVEDIPKDMLHRYFHRAGERQHIQWEAKSDLKDLITFRRINLMELNWPIHAVFDIVFCRNVMIYFNPDSQKTLIQRFANKMQSGGHLIIGHSESLFGISDVFKPIGETVYLKCCEPSSTGPSSSLRTPHALASQSKDSGFSSTHALTSSASEPRSLLTNPPSRSHPPVPSAISHPRPVGVRMASINKLLGNIPRHPIIVGEVHASRENIWVSTLLGSCLAVCMYDEDTHIGGMNHFLIPSTTHSASHASSLGVHAMELLINQIMKLGGERRRLKAKIFGGAAVVRSSHSNIGEKNIEFAKSFLETESIPIVGSHTGGSQGMHVYFNPQTTKVFVRKLDQSTSFSVQAEQAEQSKVFAESYSKPADVTLF